MVLRLYAAYVVLVQALAGLESDWPEASRDRSFVRGVAVSAVGNDERQAANQESLGGIGVAAQSRLYRPVVSKVVEPQGGFSEHQASQLLDTVDQSPVRSVEKLTTVRVVEKRTDAAPSKETPVRSEEKVLKSSCDGGDWKPPHDTNCPNAMWIDDMVASDVSPGKVILSIGCNRGNDAVAWLERYDLSRSWNTDRWIHKIRSLVSKDFLACQPQTPTVTAYTQIAKQGLVSLENQLQTKSRALCVEPVQATVELLRKASADLGFADSESFTIIQAAASAPGAHNDTTAFQDAYAGDENRGLKDSILESHSMLESPIPLTTVDALARDNGLGHVDVLTIDTEGADADVLKGAANTLNSVRYLEFEVHRDIPDTSWFRTSLQSVMEDLDAKQFDCFWAGNNGKLMSVLKCWLDEFETGMWSNVVCAKRGDVWHGSLLRFA
jgi:FkbM family methyltransferase